MVQRLLRGLLLWHYRLAAAAKFVARAILKFNALGLFGYLANYLFHQVGYAEPDGFVSILFGTLPQEATYSLMTVAIY